MSTIETFRELIKDFDLPASRVSPLDAPNLGWLMRNMGIRNASHPNYGEASKLLLILYRQIRSEPHEESETMSKKDEAAGVSKTEEVLSEIGNLQAYLETAIANFRSTFAPEVLAWENQPIPDTIDKNTAEKQRRRLTAVRFDILDGIGLLAKRMNTIMGKLG